MAIPSQSIRNDIYHAVKAAIWGGVSASDFREEVAYAWQVALDEEKKTAARELK